MCLSIFDALKQGLTWNVIHQLLTLDREMLLELEKFDKDDDDDNDNSNSDSNDDDGHISGNGNGSSGLVPFLLAAHLTQCTLDVSYSLARKSVETMIVLLNK